MNFLQLLKLLSIWQLMHFPHVNHKSSEELRTTPDFNAMVKILFWNSQGFFFFDFIIPYIVGIFLGASGSRIGFIMAIRIVGGLVSLPISGYLSDHGYSKKRLVLYGSIGRGSAYIVLYIATLFHDLDWIAVGMFVQGFGVGIFWPPFDSLVSEKSNKYHRAYAFGQRGAKMGMGNLVGTLISIIIFTFFLWITDNFYLAISPLLIFSLSNYIGGYKFYKNVDERLNFEEYCNSIKNQKDCDQSKSDIISILPKKQLDRKNSILLLVGICIIYVGLIISSINETIAKPFIQLYLVHNIESNSILILLIYFPSAIISQLLSPKLGELSDKFNEYSGIAICCILGAAITYLLIHVSTGVAFCIILILDQSLARLNGLIMQNIMSRTQPAHRGMLLGMKTWMGHLGEMTGPIIGGFLYDTYGDRSPFTTSIFIELMVIPVFFIAFWLIKPRIIENTDDKHKIYKN